MLKFQKATVLNVSDLGYIHANSWQTTYKGIASDEFLSNFTPEKRTAVFSKAIKNTSEKFYIVYLDSAPIGIVIFCNTQESNVGEIKAIYLLNNYQRQGFGHEIMDFAIKMLKQDGNTCFVLWVLEDNRQAQSFYEKYGFKFDGTKRDIDIGHPHCEMRLTYGYFI